jgi:hypothetical protein
VVDPIIISSDEEVEEAPPSRQPAMTGFQWDWKKEVTPALADLTKKQTLVSYLFNNHHYFVQYKPYTLAVI